MFDWFRSILEAMDFEVAHGEIPEPRPPAEKIRDLIRATDIVVAVLTRRDKVEGAERWKPPAWIHHEVGMAFEAGKPFALFVEQGVDVEGLETVATQYARFDRQNLGEAAPRVVRYLTGVKTQLVGQTVGPEVRAASKAIQNELGRMLSELMAPATFADWSWKLAILSARTSGRIYLLPDTVVQKVDEAYDAFEMIREALSKAKGLRSAEALLADPTAVQGEEAGKLKDSILEELRTDAIGKAFVALVELALNELPASERARVQKRLYDQAATVGGPVLQPSTPSPPPSEPPGPPTSASKGSTRDRSPPG